MADVQRMTMRVELEPRHIETVAAVMYEAVCALRKQFGEPPRPTWQFADGALRHDATVIVRRIATGAMKTPDAIHAQWRDDAYKQGWRSHLDETGAIEGQTHPEIVDWPALPPEAQTRYALMFAVASTLLANIALIVVAERERKRRTIES